MEQQHYTLDAFQQASPLDLGPVAFVKWTRGQGDKQLLHSAYITMAAVATASDDPRTREIGRRMQELWFQEKAALKEYWKEQQPLRKLRTRIITAAAKDSPTSGTVASFGAFDGESHVDGPGEPSSKLHCTPLHIQGVNVSARLMAARTIIMSHQSILREIHDLLSLNFIFTRALIEQCFQGAKENRIVAELLESDVPKVQQQDINLVAEWAFAAASKGYLDFRASLRGSALELTGLAGDLLTAYGATSALWQPRTGLGQSENTYTKRSIMPMIDAVFGSMAVVQRW